MSKIYIISFRKYEKNTLKGFFSIRLNMTSMVINDLTLHEKNGKLWVAYPAKEYQENGIKKYANTISFEDKTMNDRFQKAVIAELMAGGYL